MKATTDENFNGFEEYHLEEGEAPKSQINVQWLLRTLRSRKWIVLAVCLVVLVFFSVQAVTDVPMYRTMARIWIKALEDEAAASIRRSERFEILSRNFAEQVAVKFGMAVKLSGSYKEHQLNEIFSEVSTSIDPLVAAYQLELQAGNNYILKRDLNGRSSIIDSGRSSDLVQHVKTVDGISFKLNPALAATVTTIPFEVEDVDDVINTLQSKVTLEFTNDPTTITISMSSPDPVRLAKEVNQISQMYVEGIKLMRKLNTDDKIEILQGRFEAAGRKYNESAEEFRAFKQRYSLFGEPGIVMQKERLDNLEAQLKRVPQRKEDLLKLLDRLGTDFNPTQREQQARFVYKTVAQFEGLRDAIELQIVVSRLNDLEKRWQEEVVATGINPGHETYDALDPQIVEAYEIIRDYAEAHMIKLDEEESRLKREVAQQRAKLALSPEIITRYDELDQEVSEDLRYRNQLQHELEAARVQQSVQTMSITTFEEAPVPTVPINMDKKKRIALGGILGLSFGVVLALGLEFVDKRIKTPEEIKRYLKMPVLGVIPKVDFKDLSEYDDSERARQIDKLLVTHDYSPTPMGEAYRSLRTNLLYSKRTGRIQSLVVTSIAPNEGKSFTAANLAIIFAQQKSNTLLVDGDLRRGVLHNTFGCPKSPGLTNYLSGVAHLSEIISETHIPNLSLVSAGSLIPNPSELLGSLQMRRFLEETKRRFDLVIFDSPPLNAATDAIVIGTQVDAVPIVVRASQTNREIAKDRLEIFRNVPVNVIGIILNNAETTSQEAYSYYRY